MLKVTNCPGAECPENRPRNNHTPTRVTKFMQLFEYDFPGYSQTEFYPPATVAGFSGGNAG